MNENFNNQYNKSLVCKKQLILLHWYFILKALGFRQQRMVFGSVLHHFNPVKLD